MLAALKAPTAERLVGEAIRRLDLKKATGLLLEGRPR
jgi:hypothetical protein